MAAATVRIVARFLYDVEIEMEGTRQASEYRESQGKVEAGRVFELDKQLKYLRGVMHACSLQLAVLVSSTSALCKRLDELDAGDLCLELRAVHVALSESRVEAMARFLGEIGVRTVAAKGAAVVGRLTPIGAQWVG